MSEPKIDSTDATTIVLRQLLTTLMSLGISYGVSKAEAFFTKKLVSGGDKPPKQPAKGFPVNEISKFPGI